MTIYNTGEVEEIRNVRDADGSEASPASDERIESVRQQGANGLLGQTVYQTGGTNAEQVDSQAVPDGKAVMIQAHDSNSGPVFVGDSESQEHALRPRESVEVQVENHDEIHVRATSGGDQVVLTWVSLQ